MSAGQALANAGMQTVLDKEVEAWKERAIEHMSLLVVMREAFTVEDIYRFVGRPPRHFNSAGALLGNLAKAGKIQWTGEVIRSKTTSRHGSLIRVWRGVS